MPLAAPIVKAFVNSLVKHTPSRAMDQLVRTVMNKKLQPDADLPKGILIGLAAGVLGTVAKSAIGHFFPVTKSRENVTPRTIKLRDRALTVNIDTADWITGVLVGAAYSAAAEIAPEVTIGNGTGLGTAIYGFNNMDGAKDSSDIDLHPREENERHELLGELGYGVVVEVVRSTLRQRIG